MPPSRTVRIGPDLCDIGQAVAADRDRDRQIEQHLPRVVDAIGRIQGRSAADSSRSNPTRPAVAASNIAPACETTRLAVVSTVNDG